MKKTLSLALFLFAAFSLFAQEFAEDNYGPAEAEQEYIYYGGEFERLEDYFPPLLAEQQAIDDDRIYVIVAFDLDISGRTRPSALMRNAGFNVGEQLRGRAGLDAYISDRTQVLRNMRTLRDNPEIGYSLGERREDGTYPVTIRVRVEDSLNVIAFPVPSYHSHRGFELDVRARDYNFLGMMQPLRIDFGYSRDLDGRSEFGVMLDASIPFTAWGRNWDFRFENFFNYRPGAEEPFFFRNVTGLSVHLPFRSTTFTVGFSQSFIVNEENPSRHHGYGQFQSGMYMATRVFTSWSIPTGITTANFGGLTYTLSPSVTFNYGLPTWPLHPFRRGPFAAFTHSLSLGRVNWHGNFRRGMSFWLSNSYRYDFSRYDFSRDAGELVPITLSLGWTGHFIVNRFLGVSARLESRRWFSLSGRPHYHGDAGDALRGIRDSDISADYMLSLNLNFPFRVLNFAPSRWFNSSRFRLFDFELHVSPMVDIALFDDPRYGRDVAAAGGIELMVFPGIVRALYLRLSVGGDALRFLESREIATEITLTLGHFF